MHTTSNKSQEAFPNRFFGFGLKGFLILAILVLLIEIAVIVVVFGTDLIFTEIDTSSLIGSAQQSSHTIRQSLQSCVLTAKTLMPIDI